MYLVIIFCFFQLVHYVNRDSLGLANDFLSLGYITEGVDIKSIYIYIYIVFFHP